MNTAALPFFSCYRIVASSTCVRACCRHRELQPGSCYDPLSTVDQVVDQLGLVYIQVVILADEDEILDADGQLAFHVFSVTPIRGCVRER
jgi:hypothetical protein